jgi:hypothetical protein
MMMTLLKRCLPIRLWCQLYTALAIIALLGVSHVVFAQQVDRKVYPGTSCQAGVLGGLEVPPAPQYDEFGRILNRRIGADGTGGQMEVICPVVRDETASTAGIRTARVRVVKATEANPPQETDLDISCTLFSRTLFGAEAPVAQDSSRYAGPPNTMSLRFGVGSSPPDDPIRSFNQNGPGYYYFRCLIPAALSADPQGDDIGDVVVNCLDSDRCSGIISYWVDEIRTSQSTAQELSEGNEDDM